VLPALLMSPGQSRLILEGGTHNPLAPPFECIAQTFVPLLQRMGASVRVKLVRPGFYPAGGGRFEAYVEGGKALQPLELMQRGELQSVQIQAVVSQLPDRIAIRETKELASALADYPITVETARVESSGPGNIASVTVRSSTLTETFSAFGEVGVRAETVGRRLAGQVRGYLQSSAPVSEHLADQLLIPCALAGRGMFRAHKASTHTRTNAAVIERFLPVRTELVLDDQGVWIVQVSRAVES